MASQFYPCRLQQQARQERVHARSSNISLGDSRLHSHGTSYRSDFAAPLATGATLRSPLQVRGHSIAVVLSSSQLSCG